MRATRLPLPARGVLIADLADLGDVLVGVVTSPGPFYEPGEGVVDVGAWGALMLTRVALEVGEWPDDPLAGSGLNLIGWNEA